MRPRRSNSTAAGGFNSTWAQAAARSEAAAAVAALAELPQHFAQVRADLGVGPAVVGALQRLRRALEVAFAILHPAEAVDDERVIGRELKGFLDQLARLPEAHVAL